MALDQAVNVSVSNDTHLTLLTINDGNTVVRLVNNTEELVSRGNTFLPYPFSITLPADDSEKVPELTLSIDNADQLLITAIRSTLESPDVTVEMVLSSDPDKVYTSYDYLQLVNVTYNAMVINGSLQPNDQLHRKFPGCTYDGAAFPDLLY